MASRIADQYGNRNDMAGYETTALQGDAGPSTWDSIGNFFSENGDILASAAGAYSKYERQKAENNAQNMINQAAAKWSGFTPSLLGLVKPVTAPDPIGLAQTALTGGPTYWNNIQKIYEARAAAKKGDQSKFDELNRKEAQQKALESGLNRGT
jgi:hypothetical protein